MGQNISDHTSSMSHLNLIWFCRLKCVSLGHFGIQYVIFLVEMFKLKPLGIQSHVDLALEQIILA